MIKKVWPEAVALDAKFWQGLGEALGWSMRDVGRGYFKPPSAGSEARLNWSSRNLNSNAQPILKTASVAPSIDIAYVNGHLPLRRVRFHSLSHAKAGSTSKYCAIIPEHNDLLCG
jgi:hypothetical protein